MSEHFGRKDLQKLSPPRAEFLETTFQSSRNWTKNCGKQRSIYLKYYKFFLKTGWILEGASNYRFWLVLILSSSFELHDSLGKQELAFFLHPYSHQREENKTTKSFKTSPPKIFHYFMCLRCSLEDSICKAASIWPDLELPQCKYILLGKLPKQL